MLHSNIHLHAAVTNCKLFCKPLTETLEAHAQPTATLRDFGRPDCFLQLGIWSAGPQTLIPCKYSKIKCFKGVHCIEMLHSNIHLNVVVAKLSANLEWKHLRRMPNRSGCFLQLRIWWSGPHSFLVNIQNVSKGLRRALHWKVALIPNWVHGQPNVTLKYFGRSDCFLQLRIWLAGPHSFLVNMHNVSKGAYCTEILHSN